MKNRLIWALPWKGSGGRGVLTGMNFRNLRPPPVSKGAIAFLLGEGSQGTVLGRCSGGMTRLSGKKARYAASPIFPIFSADFVLCLNHGQPLFVGIFRGIINPGFLRWCRISSIHSIIGAEGTHSEHFAIWGLSLGLASVSAKTT